MRARIFKKLSKAGYGTYERVGDRLIPRLYTNYRAMMRVNVALRVDIRKLVTQALMGQILEVERG
jgi:hypothetical protein